MRRCLGTENPLQNYLQKGLEHKGITSKPGLNPKSCYSRINYASDGCWKFPDPSSSTYGESRFWMGYKGSLKQIEVVLFNTAHCFTWAVFKYSKTLSSSYTLPWIRIHIVLCHLCRTIVNQNPPSTWWGGVWNPYSPSQEMFGGPNTHSQGIWKTRGSDSSPSPLMSRIQSPGFFHKFPITAKKNLRFLILLRLQ